MCHALVRKRWADAHPDAVRDARLKHVKTEKRAISNARYRASEKYETLRRTYAKRYVESERGKAVMKEGCRRYWRSAKGKETQRRWRARHPDRVREFRRRNWERIKADPERRTRQLLRVAFHNRMSACSSKGKRGPAKDYGVDYEAILAVLGPRPQGDYWLEHIVPVGYFDHNDKAQIRICWDPANLSWLPREKNRAKGSSFPDEWPQGLSFIKGTGILALADPEGVSRLQQTAEVKHG